MYIAHPGKTFKRGGEIGGKIETGETMPRRRLRLHCSSDEDEREPAETLTTPNPNPNPINGPSEDHPLEISDEDFMDVHESFSPPSPPSTSDGRSFQGSRSEPTNPNLYSNGSLELPVDGFLCNLGLKLRREWLGSCVSGLTNSVPGFASFSVAEKAKLCFEQFIFSDMNYSGGGVLPPNVHALHLVDLQGPFVLQVDEIVNISCPLRGRYQKAPPGIKRCLKLSMTDGVQRVFGMEYRPIKELEVLAPAGLKVVLRNVNVRRGLLMLVPEVLEVLGGLVDDLDAARQRLVEEVNKPPRGKRTRSGEVPTLAARATLAAWTSNGVDNHGHPHSSASQSAIPSRSHDQETPYVPSGIGTRGRIVEESDVRNNTSNVEFGPSSNAGDGVEDFTRYDATAAMHTIDTTEMRTGELTAPNRRLNVEYSSSSIFSANVEEINRHDTTAAMPGTHTKYMMAEGVIASSSRSNVEFNPLSNRATSAEEIKRDDTTAAMPGVDTTEMMTEEFAGPSGRSNAESNPSPDAFTDVEDIDMFDEVDHPHILSGDKEIPFTYMNSLIAKWNIKKEDTPCVQGKIKCFLTGVKGFQFKGRSTYELHVYVDDGSLISEVLIDHTVVQRHLGHSPEEVNTALYSSEASVVKRMRETMKQFQSFLVNFEGTMLVEMNKDNSYPVALEMNQGCSSSDAWSLLRRLEMFTSPQTPHTPQRQFPDAINISP